MKKIIEINPYMLGTMAGGAADCQFWHRNLGIKVLYIVSNEFLFGTCQIRLMLNWYAFHVAITRTMEEESGWL